MEWYRLGEEWLESTCQKRNLGLLVDSRLNRSQPCAQVANEANAILACIRNTMASGNRGVIIPLCSAQARLYLKCCVQFRAPHCKKVTHLLEHAQRRAIRLTKELEKKTHEEWLMELQQLSLE